MIARVLVAIIGLPLIEIAGFVVVGERIGVAGTLAATVATALVGIYVVRLEFRGLAGRFAAAFARNEKPVAEAVEGLALAAAGLLLLLPGFVGDLMGAALLVPLLRAALARRIANRPGGPTIDGDFRRIDPTRLPPRDDPNNPPHL